jgi:hypothetical protein
MMLFIVYNNLRVSHMRIYRFMNDLRYNEKINLPTGAVGFGLGGREVIEFACGSFTSNREPLVDAVVACNLFGLAFPADIARIVRPYRLIIRDDHPTCRAKGFAETKKAVDADKSGFAEIVTIPRKQPGIAVRKDLREEYRQAGEYESRIVAFFREVLKPGHSIPLFRIPEDLEQNIDKPWNIMRLTVPAALVSLALLLTVNMFNWSTRDANLHLLPRSFFFVYVGLGGIIISASLAIEAWYNLDTRMGT